NFAHKAHRALRTALCAEKLVPALICELSRHRCRARKADPRELRDWILSLQNDPGWAGIAPYLQDPASQTGASWPTVWSQAVAAGWAPRTDHHHALLFARFCRELIVAQDFEVARYCWRECLAAWLRVFDSEYVDNWL